MLNRLSSRTVTAAKKKGLHADGGGLYLQVGPEGNKAWIFRFTLHGRSRAMGLGALHTVSLARARLDAADCRLLLQDGADPIAARDMERGRNRADAANRAPSDLIMEWISENHVPDLVTQSIMKEAVRQAACELNLTRQINEPRGVTRILWRNLKTLRPDDGKHGARYKIAGIRDEVRAVRNRDKWLTVDADRDAISVFEGLRA